jgi:hypothetical protein
MEGCDSHIHTHATQPNPQTGPFSEYATTYCHRVLLCDEHSQALKRVASILACYVQADFPLPPLGPPLPLLDAYGPRRAPRAVRKLHDALRAETARAAVGLLQASDRWLLACSVLAAEPLGKEGDGRWILEGHGARHEDLAGFIDWLRGLFHAPVAYIGHMVEAAAVDAAAAGDKDGCVCVCVCLCCLSVYTYVPTDASTHPSIHPCTQTHNAATPSSYHPHPHPNTQTHTQAPVQGLDPLPRAGRWPHGRVARTLPPHRRRGGGGAAAAGHPVPLLPLLLLFPPPLLGGG